MAKRAPTLAQKTLLIREEWLDKELTKDNLKNVYPYPYKVCDREFMDNVVMNQLWINFFTGAAQTRRVFFPSLYD